MKLAREEVTAHDDLGDDTEDLSPEPPLRQVKTNPARRPIAKPAEQPSTTSWWLNKSREELNAEAEQRVPTMRQSKEALKVKGTAREA